jgi:hypothetical protein
MAAVGMVAMVMMFALEALGPESHYANMSSRGEASSTSNGAGRIVGGEADDGVGGTGGESRGGAVDGGVAEKDRGESSRSLSSLKSRRRSTSLRRFLVLFVGGVKISGKKGGGGVGDSGVGVSGDASPPTGATATEKVPCAGTSRYSGGSTSMHSTVVTTMAAPPSRGGSHG